MNPRENGFSLVEVMIGMSLIVGLGIASSQFFRDQSRAQNAVNLDRQLKEYHLRLTNFLQNTANCNATFKYSDRKEKVPFTDIKRILRCSSNCGDGSTANRVVVGAVYQTEALDNPTDKTQWIDATRTWQIKDFAMRPVSSTGIATLNVLYELYSGRPDSRTVIKSIPIFVKFSSGQFVGCSSEKEASISKVAQTLCDALSGPAGNTTKIASYTNLTEKCDLSSTTNPNCTDRGFIVDGFSNGRTPTQQCGNLSLGKNLGGLVNSTSANCTGGKTPQLLLDSSSRLTVTCL